VTIVCFFGPDGSGKTSLAKRVASDLSGRGHKVRYSWMRGSHTLASLVSRILSRLDSFKGEDNPYYAIRIPRRLVRLWQALECASVVPVILQRFIFPEILGFTVVADRYSIDFVVWVSMTTRDDQFSEGFVAKCATHLAGDGPVLIYVTARPEILAERSGMSVELLNRQLHLYHSLIERFSLSVHTMETSETSLDESFKKAMKIVNGGLA
jgi:thymidylate kinase